MQTSKIKDKAIYGSKIAGGGAGSGGGNGGARAPGNGENNNNEGSGSSNTQSGAANNNRDHHPSRHGGSNRNLSTVEFPTLLMITMISTLMQLFC